MKTPFRTTFGARVLCWVDPARITFANLNVMCGDARIALHISLRLADGVVVVNRRDASYAWGRELTLPWSFDDAPFPFDMQIARGVASICIGGRALGDFGAGFRRCSHGRFGLQGGYRGIAQADTLALEGAFAAESAQIFDGALQKLWAGVMWQSTQERSAQWDFALNDRLEFAYRALSFAAQRQDLILCCGTYRARLRAPRPCTPESLPAALWLPEGVAALALPGTLWHQGKDALELCVMAPRGDALARGAAAGERADMPPQYSRHDAHDVHDVLWRTKLTRIDIAARIERLSRAGHLAYDDFCALQALEHCFYAALFSQLSPQAGAALCAAQNRLGLCGYVPQTSQPQPQPQPPILRRTKLSWFVRFGMKRAAPPSAWHETRRCALLAHPPPELLPDAVVTPASKNTLSTWLARNFQNQSREDVAQSAIALCGAFCAKDAFELLFAATIARLGHFEIRPWDDTGYVSQTLPFLLCEGRADVAAQRLLWLAERRAGWLDTQAIGWCAHFALGAPDLAGRTAFLDAYCAFINAHGLDPWGRAPCHALMDAMLALWHARAGLAPDLAARIVQITRSVYGTSPRAARRVPWPLAPMPAPPSAALRALFANSVEQHPPQIAQHDPEAYVAPVSQGRMAPGAKQQAALDHSAAFDKEGQSISGQERGAANKASPDADPKTLIADAWREGEGLAWRPLPPLMPLPLLDDESPHTPRPQPEIQAVVLVISCHAHLRSHLPALRGSWLSDVTARGIPYRIIIGNACANEGAMAPVPDDVIALDCPDDYAGLPDKILAALLYAQTHFAQAHVIKVDDDCFLDVDAYFDAPTFAQCDYYGRPLRRYFGHFDRRWPQNTQSGSALDKSPLPSIYADGGTGYALSPRAISVLLRLSRSAVGLRLRGLSCSEDKLVGDLLALGGITLRGDDYITHVLRRATVSQDAIAVPRWENTALPFRGSGIKLAHLDGVEPITKCAQQARRARPSEVKIWPSMSSAYLGVNSNALTLLSPVSRLADLRAAPVAVVAVMRNEMFFLPHFLAHYRALGVRAFAVADNASGDGTTEYLAAQPDVTLFSVDSDYNQSHYGVAWQEAMLAHYRLGRWSLVADADELLFWSTRTGVMGGKTPPSSLPELLRSDAFLDADAVRVMMLDMYPQGPLESADFRSGAPFEVAPFTDQTPFIKAPLMRGPFSNAPGWTSALRHRICPGARPEMFTAQKIALMRYARHMRLSDGLHYAAEVRLAARDLLFGHFKYTSAFHAKAQYEAARGQHFNDAEEYRHYAALQHGTLYLPEVSEHWRKSAALAPYLTV